MSDSTEPTDGVKCTACGAELVGGWPTCSACGAAVPSAQEPAADSADPSAPAPAPVVGSYRIDEDGQPAEVVDRTPAFVESPEGGPVSWMNRGPVLVVVLKWIVVMALVGVIGLFAFFGFIAFMCSIN